MNRTTIKWLNDRNRDAAKAECRKIDPTYSAKGRDCDEFPFAATWQGASAQPNPDRGRFSACPVNSDQNQAAGREFQTWYGVDRILDVFDPFYVRIDGTPPPDKQTGCFTYP
ncbi:hypothetical protein V5P93_002255 [Actinokineospora auranticolor]|uniref:Deoxyribonuclease NucA/NucB n=1 Tax=Actinokineospora auranticolor TaxID=155976 RepID=A0A2S6GBN5_9PSEU|nr:hypothetical protein [Actinokineospora auranticolor]PPK60744.1 deoxyribonuclease NucA/NucB [Actinokineospora auranticolor]